MPAARCHQQSAAGPTTGDSFSTDGLMAFHPYNKGERNSIIPTGEDGLLKKDRIWMLSEESNRCC